MPVLLTNQLHWMTCLWNVDSSLPVFRLNGIFDTPQHEAVREAFTNAIIHCDLMADAGVMRTPLRYHSLSVTKGYTFRLAQGY